MGIAGVWSETWACVPQPRLMGPYSICHSLFELQSRLGHHLRSVCKRDGQRGSDRCLQNPQGCGRGNRRWGWANSYNTRITITSQILYLSIFSRGTELNSASKSDHGAEIILWNTGVTAQGYLGTVSGFMLLAVGSWKGYFCFSEFALGHPVQPCSRRGLGWGWAKLAQPAALRGDLVLLVLAVLGKIIPVPKHLQAGESERYLGTEMKWLVQSPWAGQEKLLPGQHPPQQSLQSPMLIRNLLAENWSSAALHEALQGFQCLEGISCISLIVQLRLKSLWSPEM